MKGPFGLGLWEILAILLVVLLLFGARKLPEIGSSLGRGLRAFKSSISGDEEKDQRKEPTASARDNNKPPY